MTKKNTSRGAGYIFAVKKNATLFLLLLLLSASCNIFSQPATAGVYKTLNGGADWQFSSKMKDASSAILTTANIAKMAIDPQNHEIIYAGSFSSGLFKSEDAGQTWSRILSKILVYDFVINPYDPKIIYAAGSFGTSGKVLKTTDGGASWQEIYNDGTPQNIIRSVALNPALPNQLVVGTNSGTVVRSFDGGLSWKLSKDFKERIAQITWQNGQIFVLTKTKGMFRAESSGDEYLDITTAITNPPTSGGFSYASGSNISFNQSFMDVMSNNLIYLTSDSGLYKTTDSALTWQKVPLPVKNTQNNRAIAISKNSSNIVFTSVGSTIYKSVDSGLSWQTQSIASSGFVQYILIDPQLPQVVYAGTYIVSQ